MKHLFFTVALTVVSCALNGSAQTPATTEASASDFVQVVDGHLSVGGKRLKLWGAQSSLFGEHYAQIDNEVKHFRKLGFNLYRSISVGYPYSLESKRGDESFIDLMDYQFNAIAQSGGYNWIDLANTVRFRPTDVDVVDDPLVSRADWLAAMEGKELKPKAIQLMWDARTQAVYLNYIDKLMEHVNQHNGLRYADDPSIAMIELINEQWFTSHMLAGGELAALSPALVKPLLLKWNQWLGDRYKDTAGLRRAWGSLLPGESLEKSTVLLQPMRGRAALPQMAAVLGIDVDPGKSEELGAATNRARAADVVHFVTDLEINFKTKAMQRLRSHASAPNKGAAVVPVLFDTGASYSALSAYVNSFGSAFAFGSYLSMVNTDRSKPTYPWLAPLAEPPSMGGWMNHNRIEGVPGVIYETMIFQPSKYRAGYPLRTAAFAAMQDLDVVAWHYYHAHMYGETATSLPMPGLQSYWEGVRFGGDEVMLASMKLASAIFLHGDLQPPANPTVFVVGRDIIYNPDASNWEPVSNFLGPTAMQFGLRLRFDPKAPKSYFIGRHGEKYADVVRPTPQITYQWKQGLLIIDAPRVRVLAGFVPENFEFKSGEKLQNINLNIPDGTPFVREGERFVCFAMSSQDDKPLAESSDILVMANSTSWNTGFKLDTDKFDAEMKANEDTGPMAAARSIDAGTLPVLVTRVGWTLRAPWLKGKAADHIDFALHDYKNRVLTGDELNISDREPLFYVHLKGAGRTDVHPAN